MTRACVLVDQAVERLGAGLQVGLWDRRPASSSSMPCVYVRMTARYCGCTAGERTTLLRLPRNLAQGQVDGFGRGGRAIVVRGVGDFHAGQGGHQRLVFEDGLQRALRDFGLVGSVGGVELAAAQDVVDHGGDVVVVGARAEEGDQIVAGGVVGVCHLRQFSGGFHFRQRGGKVQLGEAVLGRDVVEEIDQGLDADRLEHRIPFLG